MGHSSSYPPMINSESGLDSEHTVSHTMRVMWPAIEICANAGDSQRRKNIFLWPMISISIDSQGGHLGENPFHFRRLCSTFLRVEPEHGHVYEAALVILMCSQYWEDSSGMVRPSKCIQIGNNDHIETFECRDGAHDGRAMLFLDFPPGKADLWLVFSLVFTVSDGKLGWVFHQLWNKTSQLILVGTNPELYCP